MAESVRVWDWAVRLTHWSFPILIPALWWTAENHRMGLHMTLGLVLLGFLTFRIVWGFVGTRTARFSDFVRGPAKIAAYLKGAAAGTIGHNPLGALSVVALLLAMLVQVSLGVFSGDPYDGATGPLNALVGTGTADTLTEIHHIVANVVFALAGLHIAAIAFYYFAKKMNLVKPMITGRKQVEGGAQGIQPASFAKVLIVALIAAGFAVWVGYGAPPLT